MTKGKNQGIIFYPSGSRYRMWSNYSRSKNVPEWQITLLGKFYLSRCPDRYTKAKDSVAELGLSTY